MLSADFNGDGHADVYTGNDAGGSVSILLGHGDGTFAQPVTLAAGNTHSIDIADLTGDGYLDLISGGRTDQYVNFYRNDGSGNFVRNQPIQTGGPTARGVLAADFNEDGRADIAVTDENLNTVTILLAD